MPVWAAIGSGRTIGTLLTVSLRKTIMRSLSRGTSGKTHSTLRVLAGLHEGPALEHEV